MPPDALAEHFRSRADDILHEVYEARQYLFPAIERESEEAGRRFLAERQARAVRDKIKNELERAEILVDLAYVMASIHLKEDVPDALREVAWDLHNAIGVLKRSGSQAYRIARGASVEEVMAEVDVKHGVFDFPQEKAKVEGREKLAEAFCQNYLDDIAV